MLSPIIKKKIESRYKHEIKYARECEGLATHISSVCKCKISSSTVKRLWGFLKGSESSPRLWTLDLLANYINYDSWDDLQNELAGNKTKKKERVEYIDCSVTQPGKKIMIMFGKIVLIKIECLGKHRFIVIDEVKTDLQVNDVIELEKIQIDLPLLVKVQRAGTITSGIILGGVTGVTEIIEIKSSNEKKTNSIKK